MNYLSTLFILIAGSLFAYTIPTVPNNMALGDMELELSRSLQKDLQTEVNNLMKSEKYFMNRASRAAMYFPIIEGVLKENNVPVEVKYLAMQESSLISDAVSSSNAVGYWQFKVPSATEVGMKIDRNVDERKNIVSSTKGTCVYLKKNYQIGKNWVYAILSHYTGPGGIKKYIEDKYVGAKKMKLQNSLHWYMKKFLAHVIAYGSVDYGKIQPDYNLALYTKGGGESLRQISKNTDIELSLLEEYNKWLKSSFIPENKIYYVVLPVKYGGPVPVIASGSGTGPEEVEREKPFVEINLSLKNFDITFNWNGKPAMEASVGDDINSMALKGGISRKRFVRYNELKGFEPLEKDVPYYFQRKKRRAEVPYHTLQNDQSLWEVSQKYGMRLKSIYRFNRIDENTYLEPGTVLWLREKRPEDQPFEIKKVETKRPETKPVKETEEKKEPKRTEKSKETLIPVENSKSEEKNTGLEKADTSVVKELSGADTLSPTELEKTGTPSLKDYDTIPTSESSISRNEQDSSISHRKDEKIQVHSVGQGETLFSIAKKYSVDLDSLISWNRLETNSINYGQQLKICIPNETSETKDVEQCKIHEVKQGETLYSIARNYDTTVKNIIEWNKMDDNALKIGQKIKIFTK